MWLLSTAASAQSEGALSIGAEAEKKLSRQASVSVEGDFRSRNDFKTADRWSLSAGASYKLGKNLKAAAAYQLIWRNNRESLSYNTTDGAVTGYNNWRPSYWGVNHRLSASLTGSHKVHDIRFSLRERWQYTYRPSKDVERWDFDNAKWETKTRSGKGKNVLRSRLQAEYSKKKARLLPFASIEAYNSWAVDKVRYTIGTDYKLNKQHSLSLYYRFQDAMSDDDLDYDPNIHLVGLSYTIKL